MMAFYLVRGQSKSDLENLTYMEKLFYYEAMNIYFKQEAEKYNSIFGSGEGK
ncbi:hypothetical protein [Cohnella sp. WQ 127256]|uniref:hypothetical protein n=1 Tax=Cohnella sp. WQ 127256 TaxID=2938790 RepID=UPI002117D24A|nr:hypothetical protein [Cohnella sp. WQ 127256]